MRFQNLVSISLVMATLITISAASGTLILGSLPSLAADGGPRDGAKPKRPARPQHVDDAGRKAKTAPAPVVILNGPGASDTARQAAKRTLRNPYAPARIPVIRPPKAAKRSAQTPSQSDRTVGKAPSRTIRAELSQSKEIRAQRPRPGGTGSAAKTKPAQAPPVQNAPGQRQNAKTPPLKRALVKQASRHTAIPVLPVRSPFRSRALGRKMRLVARDDSGVAATDQGDSGMTGDNSWPETAAVGRRQPRGEAADAARTRSHGQSRDRRDGATAGRAYRADRFEREFWGEPIRKRRRFAVRERYWDGEDDRLDRWRQRRTLRRDRFCQRLDEACEVGLIRACRRWDRWCY